MKKIFSSLLMATMMISTIPLQSSASLLPGSNEPDPATIKAAFKEFRSLSKQERKQRIKNVKKEFKVFKKEKKSNRSVNVEMWLLILLAILLPPLAVYLYYEEINSRFWLSIILWFCFILPGVIYALLVVTGTV
jgi:uncharacterized membrane protein YqaE (UPF0057 family)